MRASGSSSPGDCATPTDWASIPDGRLLALDQGADDRGSRPVGNAPDLLFEVRQGAWYGWPDFAAGIRLDDPYWGDKGRGREPLLAEHPDPNPPKPFVTFDRDHGGPNGVDFCRDPEFGFPGDAFVALFGDIAPVTTRAATPRGFKVVRVDMRRRRVFDFAVNKIQGPASKLPHEGFERPSHCQFGPDGALYVGEAPREPVMVPLHAMEDAVGLAGLVGAAVAGGLLVKRMLRERK